MTLSLVTTIWHELFHFLPFLTEHSLRLIFLLLIFPVSEEGVRLFLPWSSFMSFEILFYESFSPPIFFFSCDCFPVLKQQQKLSQSISPFFFLISKLLNSFCLFMTRFTNTMILLNTSLFFQSYHFLALCEMDFFFTTLVKLLSGWLPKILLYQSVWAQF